MRAKRNLGQNFLVGSHYPERIVQAVAPVPEDTIIEIGPGHGALTELLTASGASVIAIELDHDLIPELTTRFGLAPNFRLVEADALEVDFCSLLPSATQARVVANLPYYISTPILQRLLTFRHCVRDLTLMLQREVVERIVATPGGKEYGYLSVLVQFYCTAESLFDVPPGAFRPAPKIWSSVMRLRVRPEPGAEVSDEGYFIELTKSLFAQRRKTILNNLRASQSRLGLSDSTQISAALSAAQLDPQRRAETLSIAEIARLANLLANSK